MAHSILSSLTTLLQCSYCYLIKLLKHFLKSLFFYLLKEFIYLLLKLIRKLFIFFKCFWHSTFTWLPGWQPIRILLSCTRKNYIILGASWLSYPQNKALPYEYQKDHSKIYIFAIQDYPVYSYIVLTILSNQTILNSHC